jgi:mRNA interferase RelE/StbE
LASSIHYKESVAKDLKRIDKVTARQLLSKLEHTLSSRPDAGEPLKGEFQGLFKYRVGDYRIIYAKSASVVLVLRIAHRKEVYR